ncbi:MAG: LCP family protein, partial [Bacillota bacterium]|nr:LCP family protein [Bacillota bacterium]
LSGVDSRESGMDKGSRSDSIMILSIDKEHNKLKLTSLMRDLYVSVDGHGKTKITHAYAYGGPQLAVKTINENFGMNIKDYATVDFFGLEKIINSVGGVPINVEKAEIPVMNSYINETSGIEKVTPPYITKAGLQNLNGIQAVAYSRIRYVGNADYERTERQRKVLEQVIKKVTNGGITKLPSLINTMLPFVETSMSKTDILATGTTVLTKKITALQQFRLPEDGLGQGQTINKVYYLVADLNVAKAHLYKFIYEEEMPEN